MYRIKRTSNRTKIGDKVGWIDTDNDGYEKHKVEIKGHSYNVSRIIFLLHNGYLPEFIDHIDRNSLNNKIENLREATPSENSKNRTSAKNSASQYLGVSLGRNKYKSKYWIVRIKANGVNIYCGNFKFIDEDKAALQYNKLAVMHHKEFANLNIIKPKKV